MLAFFHAMGKRRYCNYGDSSAPIRELAIRNLPASRTPESFPFCSGVGDLILIQMADIAKMTAITPKATAHMASYTQRLYVYLVRDVTGQSPLPSRAATLFCVDSRDHHAKLANGFAQAVAWTPRRELSDLQGWKELGAKVQEFLKDCKRKSSLRSFTS